MNNDNNKTQFDLDMYGNHSAIDNNLLPLLASNGFRTYQGANLIRGR